MSVSVTRAGLQQDIVDAILEELPATWHDLEESKRVRRKARSVRTLAKYLTELRAYGVIRRIVDEKTNAVLYVKHVEPRVEHSDSFLGAFENRRREYDLDYLYWGGHERGPEGWWKQTKIRRRSAQSAMKAAVDSWYKPYAVALEKIDRPDPIIAHMISSFALRWIALVELYFGLAFGAKLRLPGTHIFTGHRKKPLEGTGSWSPKSELWDRQTSEFPIVHWHQNDPISFIWKRLLDDSAVLALAVKSGRYKVKQIEAALEEAEHSLSSKGIFGASGRREILDFLLVDTKERWRSAGLNTITEGDLPAS
jgi:hypothetical protein